MGGLDNKSKQICVNLCFLVWVKTLNCYKTSNLFIYLYTMSNVYNIMLFT